MNKILFVLFLISQCLFAQNKLLFDVDKNERGNYPTQLSKITDISDQISNSKISATILSGGYYTIGTIGGFSNSTLDDNCEITFGHPYAKTSYPIFSIDGKWYKFDDYFSTSELKVVKISDTLKVLANKAGLFSATFMIYLNKTGCGVTLSQIIKNLDATEHKIALGFVFDPALGKWGDGSLETTSGFSQTNNVFQGSSIPSDINIWEKSKGAKGIGINLSSVTQKPEYIIAANWLDIYNSIGLITPNLSKTVYDLDMEYLWQEQLISAYQSYKSELNVNLIQPDFPSSLFLRWDLQNFLTVQTGQPFPQNFDTFIQVNKAEPSITNATIKIELPSFLTSSNSQYTVNSFTSNSSIVKISLSSHYKYSDKIEEIVAKVTSGGNSTDEIHRMIYMPATPVSDSGLDVKIDSLHTSSFPKIDLRFSATRKSSGAKVFDLSSDNIFLFEDGTEITKYDLKKDLSGGVNSVDIVFVLDVTGSMGSSINAVKNNIIEFADSLNTRGIDFRLGLVTFLDVVENSYPFTNDSKTFKNYVDIQSAHAGGDGPENSLQALLDASKFPFRNNCSRVAIWITDANYHESDSFTSLTKDAVLNSLLANGVRVHSIGPTAYKSSYYDPIINPTGGNFYDISGNFRDILLDISKISSSGLYILSYNSTKGFQPNQIKLQVRYSGLGGETTISPSNFKPNTKISFLTYFPNPFNPEITFVVNMGKYIKGEMMIYNTLGQLVKSFDINSKTNNIKWKGRNELGNPISSGLYIVRLVLQDGQTETHSEFAKILYLK